MENKSFIRSGPQLEDHPHTPDLGTWLEASKNGEISLERYWAQLKQQMAYCWAEDQFPIDLVQQVSSNLPLLRQPLAYR